MRQSKSKNKKFIFFVVLVLFASILGLFARNWWTVNSAAVVNDATLKRLVITKGASGVQIGNKLYEEGFIKNPLAFKLYIQVKGYSSSIKAGEYDLAQNLSLIQTVNALLKGPSEVWVTIPEGLRREEIPFRFASVLGMTESATNDFVFDFNQSANGSEGYLFPETYLVPKEITGAKAYQIMRTTFDTLVTQQMREDATKSTLSFDELITLASIVERETRTAVERPMVAAIYLNRLSIGMALQADATAQYATANTRCDENSACDWWITPTRADLAIDSLYNTYKYAGLPPGPIANPGLVSIEAVIYPASNAYFYYLHDSQGTIHYGETLEEHNANIARYLR